MKWCFIKLSMMRVLKSNLFRFKKTVGLGGITKLFLVFFITTACYATQEIYPLPTIRQEAQFKHLLTELRCLVCQNQDLADSNAGLALDLRSQVYTMVKDGRSDSEIVDYLTTRYGDFILFKPPFKPLTYLLWLAPLLFLCVGLVIFWRKFKTETL